MRLISVVGIGLVHCLKADGWMASAPVVVIVTVASGAVAATAQYRSHLPCKSLQSASIWPRASFSAVDAEGHVVVRKALRRAQVLPFFAKLSSCLVSMEACGTSHHWALGLTPLQNCSGGRERMGRISRMGDRYLRRLLVVGMTSLVRRARIQPASVDPRLSAMLARKPARLVTVAAANRTARVAWAIMTRGGTYRAPISAAA